MNDDAEEKMLRYLESLSLEEREELMAQAVVTTSASEIVCTIARGDLLGAWPRLHHDLRLSWVQAWQALNTESLQEHGWDLESSASELAAESPGDHELWEHFARVRNRDIAKWGLDPERLGIGSTPRLVAPNVEEVQVYPVAPESMELAPGEEAWVIPGLMVLEGDQWFLLNLGSTTFPVPGYPPEV